MSIAFPAPTRPHTYLTWVLFCLALCSCSPSDSTWDQTAATNEFDSKGMRHGKWVDYSADSSWMTLTEYDHGFPIGVIRDFNDTTLRQCYSLKISSPRDSSFKGGPDSGVFRDYGILVGTHVYYSEYGKLLREISFRDDDTSTNKILDNPTLLNFRPKSAKWFYDDGRTIIFSDVSSTCCILSTLNSENLLVSELKLYYSLIPELEEEFQNLRRMLDDKEIMRLVDADVKSIIDQFKEALDFLPKWGYSIKLNHSISLSGQPSVDTTWTWPVALDDFKSPPRCMTSCTQQDAYDLFWGPMIQIVQETQKELEKEKELARKRRNNTNKSGIAFLDLDHIYRCPYCNTRFALRDGYETEICENYVRDQTPNFYYSMMGQNVTCHDMLQEYYGTQIMRQINARPNWPSNNLYCSKRCYQLDR